MNRLRDLREDRDLNQTQIDAVSAVVDELEKEAD